MTILVTGGNGFIGSAVEKKLVLQGGKMRVPVRRSSQVDLFLTLDIVNGDILDQESLSPALSGCDTVFHCAAWSE